jgi:hypothetical protein
MFKKSLDPLVKFRENRGHTSKGEIEMSPRNHKISSLIDGRLAAYATLAGAALAAPAMVQNANADIVYSGIVNYNIPSTTSGIYLNAVTGVTSTTPAGAPGWDLNLWSSSTLEIWGNNSASPNDGVLDNFTGGTSATLVDNLPFGTLIDGTWTYGRTDASVETTGPTAFLLNSSNNLFGFRFLNEGTGVYDFGWARVSLSGTLSAQPRLVVEYAYDDTGAGILAGVPEPSTFALLGVMAAGALGVRAWRKRKNS